MTYQTFCKCVLRLGIYLGYINSCWPSDWRHQTRSTLVQVMACCLTTPSHYLDDVDLSSVRYCTILCTGYLSLVYSQSTKLKLQLHLPGAIELTKSVLNYWMTISTHNKYDYFVVVIYIQEWYKPSGVKPLAFMYVTYRSNLRSLPAAILSVKIFLPLRSLPGVSAVILPRPLSIHSVVGYFFKHL